MGSVASGIASGLGGAAAGLLGARGARRQESRLDAAQADVIRAADPFRPHREQFAEGIEDFMDRPWEVEDPWWVEDPWQIEDLPGYQHRFDTGLAAIERQMSARGMRHSPRRLLAAQEFGQQHAMDEFDRHIQRTTAERGFRTQREDQRFQQLAMLSGAGQGAFGAAAQGTAGLGRASAGAIGQRYQALGFGLQQLTGGMGALGGMGGGGPSPWGGGMAGPRDPLGLM